MVLMFISMSHVANTYPAQTNTLKQGSDQLHCIATWTTYKWSISISSTSLALGLHNNPLHSDLKVDVMEWIYVDLGRVGYSLTL